MKTSVLRSVLEATQSRLHRAKQTISISSLEKRAAEAREPLPPHCFRDRLADLSKINIIAEFKRASPSKGVINDLPDPAKTAQAYQACGAAAISVLTEPDFFRGSIEDLSSIRTAIDIPVLRKDFIIDEYQLFESAAAGADAILLIVAAISPVKLKRLSERARALGMDAVIEVHDISEMQTAIGIGADIIGVNNRDLQTFSVSLDVSRELIRHAPANTAMIAESGLRSHKEIAELRKLGYSGFLIGETLMRSADPAEELRRLTGSETNRTANTFSEEALPAATYGEG
jgi:indole-3-glycerol phosphate synthase